MSNEELIKLINECGASPFDKEEIKTALEKYLHEEREKAKGLVEVLETLDGAIDYMNEQNAIYIISTQDKDLIKQVLSDYKQKQ